MDLTEILCLSLSPKDHSHTLCLFALVCLLDRSLKLSALCLKLNPANYTVWHYRRQCLESLGRLQGGNAQAAVEQDLNLAASLGGDNPKNYQIWYHRRALLEKVDRDLLVSSLLVAELEYISQVLDEDAKNYHAWSHRQWLVQTVDQEDIWKKEIEYCTYFHSKGTKFLLNDKLLTSSASPLFFRSPRVD